MNNSYAPKCEIITPEDTNWPVDQPSEMVVLVPVTLWPQFQQLIQRGAQTWADAPPAMKELADLVTNGQVLQNYWDQNKDQHKKLDT